MNINFKKALISISLILILFAGIGMVSASLDNENIHPDSYNEDIGDINNINSYDDLLIEDSKENSIANDDSIGDSDYNSIANDDSIANANLDDSNFNDANLDDSNLNDLKSYGLNSKIKASDSQTFKDIQSLIDVADENDTIELSGVYYGNGEKIVLNKSLTIKGDSSTILDAQFLSEIMDVNAPFVVIDNIDFKNSLLMGLSCTKSNIRVSNSNFNNCIGGELGSALNCAGNNISVLNCTFKDNIANKSSCHHTDGAAIYLVGDNAVIDGCVFINNSGYNYETASSGGAIHYFGNDGLISNCLFINNSATSKYGWTLHGEEETYLAMGYGGAIYLTGYRDKIVNSSFIGGISHYNGGALYFKAARDCEILNSTFINNTSIGEGGAIYLDQNIYDLKIDSCNFTDNKVFGYNKTITYARDIGGAVFASKFVFNLLLNNCIISGNNGSSIYFLGENLTLRDSIISDPKLENSVVVTNGSLENNYWGINLNSTEDFISSKIISNEGFIPSSWYNMNIDGLENLSQKGVYNYSISFDLQTADEDSSLSYSILPDYLVKLENSGLNQLSDSYLLIENNGAKFTYDFSQASRDTISIYDRNSDMERVLNQKSIEAGLIRINDTGNDTKDLQDAIDNADSGDIIVLDDRNYAIDTIFINKSICIDGNGLARIGLLDSSKVFFNISENSDSTNVASVEISGINFIADNGNVLVLATAVNDTNPSMIDVCKIEIRNNTVLKASDDVVSESITVLELDSERGVLYPINELLVIGNTLESGMNPFNFVVTGFVDGSSVYIPSGGNIADKTSTEIICANMTTNAININLDGRNGEYFIFQLLDSNGNPLANKDILVGFNGHVYNYVTDLNGSAKTQINLGLKGGYTFAVSFLGDDEYNASFAVAKITVNPEPVKLTAAKKSYKANAKTKSLTATLKTSRGAAISGMKLSFTLNGKTYTATSNSKGIASVKVSLTSKGTYSFSVKFAGTERYASVSAKSSLVLS